MSGGRGSPSITARTCAGLPSPHSIHPIAIIHSLRKKIFVVFVGACPRPRVASPVEIGPLCATLLRSGDTTDNPLPGSTWIATEKRCREPKTAFFDNVPDVGSWHLIHLFHSRSSSGLVPPHDVPDVLRNQEKVGDPTEMLNLSIGVDLPVFHHFDQFVGVGLDDFLAVGMDQGGPQQSMGIGDAAVAMMLLQAGGTMNLGGGEILPWHRRSTYEPDAPARGVPQSPRWHVGLVCARMRNFLAGVILGAVQRQQVRARKRIIVTLRPSSPRYQAVRSSHLQRLIFYGP